MLSLSIRDRKSVEKVISKLAEISDPPHGLLLSIEPIENDEDDTAYVTYDGRLFHVVIDSRMPVGMIFDYVIHELAHVHSWHFYEHDDHGDEFGKSYAYLYREYLKLYDKYLCK
jgi:hypothetical protein